MHGDDELALAGDPAVAQLFEQFADESRKCLAAGLVVPAYENALKCSHTFNLLDARGAISVTERQAYINRVRALSRKAADTYLAKREELGYPLLKGADRDAYFQALEANT